ncbi:MAG: hypothetical protein MJZ98_00650 [Paludibacteraceae bacterium]|nr:hypothetical protein [Paludibacteraceae bacterium]
MKERILKALKPKVASFGFSAEELEGVVEIIIGNLNSESTDEEVNAQCEAVIPYVKMAQAMGNRVIAKNKPKPVDEPKPKVDEQKDEMPSWFKTYAEQQEQRFSKIESERSNAIRESRLNELLKDTGKFGERIKRNFNMMHFESEEAFNTFLDNTKADIEDYKKEVSEGNLKITPLGGFGGGNHKEVSQDEIKKLAAKSKL